MLHPRWYQQELNWITAKWPYKRCCPYCGSYTLDQESYEDGTGQSYAFGGEWCSTCQAHDLEGGGPFDHFDLVFRYVPWADFRTTRLRRSDQGWLPGGFIRHRKDYNHKARRKASKVLKSKHRKHQRKRYSGRARKKANWLNAQKHLEGYVAPPPKVYPYSSDPF